MSDLLASDGAKRLIQVPFPLWWEWERREWSNKANQIGTLLSLSLIILMKAQNLSPLLYKEYRFFVFMRFFYTMALRMVGTVVAYQLFQLTRTSFSIGLVGLSEFIPVFGLALYAGHIIDRSDKRTLLLKSILYYAVCAFALLIVTLPIMESRLSSHALEISF